MKLKNSWMNALKWIINMQKEDFYWLKFMKKKRRKKKLLNYLKKL